MAGQPPDETEEAGGGVVELPSDGHTFKEKMEFLRGARRQLSPEELSSPVVSRFLIEEIERLDGEVTSLEKYRTDFHRVDRELAVIRQEKVLTQSMNLRDATVLAIGSAGIGGAPSYIQISNLGWVFFGLSVLLVAMSFIKKKV